MKGINFVIDETGKKTAVLIDLEQWGDLWEDFYDLAITQEREGEPTAPWEEIETE